MNRRELVITVGIIAVMAAIMWAFAVLGQRPESIGHDSPAPIPVVPIPAVFEIQVVDNEELYPLWEDNHVWLEEGRPPWPRGLSEPQIDILRHADRIVVGRINEYGRRVNETTEDRFHRHRIIAAVEVETPDDRDWIVNHLIGIRHLGDAGCEFYPGYAMRVWGNGQVLDVEINDDCEPGMYFITESERRYLKCSESAIAFLEHVLATIERPPADDVNR